MLSILGDYNYSFPKPIKLEKKLKDILEDNVDEKYFLSDKCIKTMLKHDIDYKPTGVAPTLTTELAHHTGKNFTPKIIREIDYSLKIKNATKKGYLEATDGDGVDISSRMEYHRGTVQKGKTQTLTTMGGENNGVVSKDLRIRKLTPKECFRLMNVKDEDFNKVKTNQSDSSLYHLAGDSICSNILMALFGEMLDIDWEKKVKEMLDMLGDDINE